MDRLKVEERLDEDLELSVSEETLCNRFPKDANLGELNAARLCWPESAACSTWTHLVAPNDGSKLMATTPAGLVGSFGYVAKGVRFLCPAGQVDEHTVRW